MGGCTSASSWADGRDATLTDALTTRQIQIIRDTWEVIVSDDVQSAVWLEHLNRYMYSTTDHPSSSSSAAPFLRGGAVGHTPRI